MGGVVVRFALKIRKARAHIFSVAALLVFAGLTAHGQSLVDSQRQLRKNSAQKLGYAASILSESSLDAEAKPTWGLGAMAIYSFSEKWIGFAEVEFQSLYSREDADPKLNEGIGDATLSLYWPSAWTHQTYGRVTALTSLSLPTSEISQRQSKIVGTRSYVRLTTPFSGAFRRLSLVSQLALDLNHFTYDLSSRRGGSYNSPIRTGETMGFALQLARTLTWQNLYTYAQRYDYAGDWTLLQSFTSQGVYQITPEVRASAAYTWSDRVYTEDLPFNPRQSSLSGEISYAF